MKRNHLVGLSLTLLSAAAFAGCGPQMPEPAPVETNRIGLTPFAGCDDVLAFVQTHALEKVGPYGFSGDEGWGFGWEEDGGDGTSGGDEGGWDQGGEPAGDDGGGDGANGGGGEGSDHSGTNVQELGVDEPDIVKTDGNRILALAQGKLHVIDLSSGSATLTGAVEIVTLLDPEYGYWYGGSEMLVHGDRVIVVARRGTWDLPQSVRDALGHDENSWQSITQLVEIDVSNPAAPAVIGNLYLEGDYVSGRQIDAAARFVLRFWPRGLAFKYPWDFLSEREYDYGEFGGSWNEAALARAERLAEAHNRSLIEATTLQHWMPRFVRQETDGALSSGLLVECERAFEPGTFAGLGLLSVLTVDMSEALALRDAVGVFSEGETVYASKENLYVATWPQWLGEPDEQPEILSYVHKFDIGNPEKADYRASGEVPGHLLSQWSMSEHQGDLRVATTEWGWWSNGSQSFVSVLREIGGELELVGQVGGIGHDEQIFGVRFIGDTGYVVTFRQTDPLFTIDLHDPSDPKVVGELQMPGYSAYLHPIGKGILLGVGRDGDELGNLGGASLNIFDVSDPANPVRLHQAAFGEGWASSTVEWDHRAFLYWEPERLVVIPVTSWDWDTDGYFAGAVAYRVDPQTGISLAGIIENEPTFEDEWGWSYGSEISRSIVIGSDLYTMSESGLRITTMADMAEGGWLSF